MQSRLQTTHFFYKNARFIFAQNLRTILASAEEQSLKLSIKVVNKTAAFKCRTISKVHSA